MFGTPPSRWAAAAPQRQRHADAGGTSRWWDDDAADATFAPDAHDATATANRVRVLRSLAFGDGTGPGQSYVRRILGVQRGIPGVRCAVRSAYRRCAAPEARAPAVVHDAFRWHAPRETRFVVQRVQRVVHAHRRAAADTGASAARELQRSHHSARTRSVLALPPCAACTGKLAAARWPGRASTPKQACARDAAASVAYGGGERPRCSPSG
mmetsp:Transcript_19994/g.52589  ORF Transcript_19994/g.52589 Transcript_19994/m.52589 type:complete len:211 (+) Transcript_19994:384-1016(+)